MEIIWKHYARAGHGSDRRADVVGGLRVCRVLQSSRVQGRDTAVPTQYKLGQCFCTHPTAQVTDLTRQHVSE